MIDLNFNGHDLQHYLHPIYKVDHYICQKCNVIFYKTQMDDRSLVIVEDMSITVSGHISRQSILNTLSCEEIIIKNIIE